MAISGRSFNLFDDPDMKEIIGNALANTGETTKISSVHVREGVELKAAELKQQIIERLRERRLSLSADFGNRNGVDFLGKLPKILFLKIS